MSGINNNQLAIEVSHLLLDQELEIANLVKSQETTDKVASVAKDSFSKIITLVEDQLAGVEGLLGADRAQLDLDTQLDVVGAISYIVNEELGRPGLSDDLKTKFEAANVKVKSWAGDLERSKFSEVEKSVEGLEAEGQVAAQGFPEIKAKETAFIEHVVGAKGESLQGSEFREKVLEDGYGVIRVQLDGKEVTFKGIGKDAYGNFKAAGAYGRVFFGQGEYSHLVIKVMKTNDANIDAAVQEGALLSKLDGTENTISASHVFYMGATDGSNDDFAFFVMDNCDKGELFDFLSDILTQRPSKEGLDQLVKVDIGAINGLEEVHNEGVVHRDIKLENIFLKSAEGGGYKGLVGDVGLAKSKDELNGSEVCGTPGYIAPELYDIDGGLNFGEKTDVFAMGVTIFSTLAGGPPYAKIEAIQWREYQEEVKDFQVTRNDFAHWPCSDAIKDKMVEVTSKSLSFDPASRSTLQELKEGMKGIQKLLGEEAIERAA